MKDTEPMVIRTLRPGQEALDEVERELNVRSRCFPRWIADGRVSRTDAQDRLDRLATAHVLLEALSAADMNAAVADIWKALEEAGQEQRKIGATAP